MAKRLMQIVIVLVSIVLAGLVLGAAPKKAVKISPVSVCPVCRKPIEESEDSVLRMYKGDLIPIHFEHAIKQYTGTPKSRDLLDKLSKLK